MQLPEHYVEDGLKKAQGSTFMGVPVLELSRDELIAAMVHGWEECDKKYEQLQEQSLSFMGALCGKNIS
jgi:hypothetical protein